VSPLAPEITGDKYGEEWKKRKVSHHPVAAAERI